MRYHWYTVKYEGDDYDVCVDTHYGFEIDEIRPVDSEINIMPVMSERIIDWFCKQAEKQSREPKETITYELAELAESVNSLGIRKAA